MARMSIDDTLSRDPRVKVLAATLGWSRRETVGCLVMDVWPVCYDQRTHLLSERTIDAAADHPGFAKAMLEAELLFADRSGKLRVVGARKRIAYLDHKSAAGRQGGLKSGESRKKDPKQTSSTGGSTPQARGNPTLTVTASASASASAPVSDLEEKNSAAPSAGGSAKPKARKSSKPFDCSEAERAAAAIVLNKLSSRNGVRYSGTDAHLRLVVGRMRDGVSVDDMRKVIGYCAIQLKWAEKPELADYLRPETLFGPQTIAKYLDPARTWFEKQNLQLEPIGDER